MDNSTPLRWLSQTDLLNLREQIRSALVPLYDVQLQQRQLQVMQTALLLGPLAKRDATPEEKDQAILAAMARVERLLRWSMRQAERPSPLKGEGEKEVCDE